MTAMTASQEIFDQTAFRDYAALMVNNTIEMLVKNNPALNGQLRAGRVRTSKDKDYMMVNIETRTGLNGVPGNWRKVARLVCADGPFGEGEELAFYVDKAGKSGQLDKNPTLIFKSETPNEVSRDMACLAAMVKLKSVPAITTLCR